MSSWMYLALTSAVVAKTVSVIEGSWRYMGGASIVFHGVKTYIFGKLVRTIEYPDGEMVSIVVRTNNINRLKNEIIKQQPALFPGVELGPSDVKYLARWTPPHFTEQCSKNRDLKWVADGGVVFWSRFDPIPKRNVTLDVKDKELIKLDQAISFVTKMGREAPMDSPTNQKLTEPQENALIDLLLEKDDGVLALHRNFNSRPALFKHHALRYLTTKGKIIDPVLVDFLSSDQKQQQQQTNTVSATSSTTTTTASTNQQKEKEKEKEKEREREREKEKLNQQQTLQQSPTNPPSPHELTNTLLGQQKEGTDRERQHPSIHPSFLLSFPPTKK
ncbi:hypothetical protein DFA_12018 [Cavenderia fasciculata]|uniref:Uncharacterized protein n=1 Tax=Cavenderia fasciculata TaxID=261658 RepID=F4QFE7_CACFS|nr:uncharacterized protein DFA_12018 [Cavenderia fasciculata]EGG14248.1 hypothetical protein DFA_12018 [Cavenderia fasciculata]|eukprot:XP_004350957.1 hypothetical protein DFA_12018 [Cavenderia fasciculata]